MLRTSLLVPLACIALIRGTLCSCSPEEPCEYDEVSLAADDETPWGTTPAADIAALEIPQHGTWSWGESTEYIDIDPSGVVLPAWASFVHDPETIRYAEHVGGGQGVACNGPTVSVDGTLTITDELGGVIISVPITALRQYTAEHTYGASPEYSPISAFSTSLHEKAEWDIRRVVGAIFWINGARLYVEFFYNGQSMYDETTGGGVINLVGLFEPDG